MRWRPKSTRHGKPACYKQAFSPPSTGRIAPITYLAFSDSRNATASATSSNGAACEFESRFAENHTREASPPEREERGDRHFSLVRVAYESATGNRWNKSDFETYEQNHLKEVPLKRIISTFEAVIRRTPSKINSLRYFVQEIKSVPDPRNRAWQKKRLEKMVHRIRDNSVGRHGYSLPDFVEELIALLYHWLCNLVSAEHQSWAHLALGNEGGNLSMAEEQGGELERAGEIAQELLR